MFRLVNRRGHKLSFQAQGLRAHVLSLGKNKLTIPRTQADVDSALLRYTV